MIRFTDYAFFASPEGTFNDDTGFFEPSNFDGIGCRISFGANKIINNEGHEVLAQAKIYLPTNSGVTIKHKFKFSDEEGSREFDIQSIEYKTDIQGKLNHIVVYV